MNKDELLLKSKEELVEKILKMKEKMTGGEKCQCTCEPCSKCEGSKSGETKEKSE
jgi:hypothetical protein